MPIPVRICYALAYRDPSYVRSQSLLAALARISGVEVILAINRARGPLRYLQMLRQLLRIRREKCPDLYLLGFRGHEIAWLVRSLTRGRPLVLDAMMSPYLALAEERKLGGLGALLAPLWRPIEAHALRNADLILTDTPLHAQAYEQLFGIAPQRILAVPVGAFEPAQPVAPQPVRAVGEPLTVLFYGSFLPLHGVDVIAEAAARVRDLPLRFRFIGGQLQQVRALHATCARHGVTAYSHTAWVPITELIEREIPAADLCLGGPFGGTPQARRVITGKTSQCLALGRATVVGRIEADDGLVDRENCLLVPQADPNALAAALRWAHVHRERLPAIAAAGRVIYAQRLSIDAIDRALVPALRDLAAASSRAAPETTSA